MNARELVRWDEPLDNLDQWERQPEIETEYVVGSESDPETAYLVREVDALDVPFPESDVVEDAVLVTICSCPQYQYRCWPDEAPLSLEAIPRCKHCRSVNQDERARADESQASLENAVGK